MSARKPQRFVPTLEALEPRDMMAAALMASLNLTTGHLTVEGTNYADQIQIRQIGSRMSVEGPTGQVYSVDVSKVSQINVFGLGGNDTIILAKTTSTDTAITKPSYIEGGAGADIIRAGEGNDLIFGGSRQLIIGDGGDDIRGNGGADTIYGNEGGDELYGNNGNDFLYGGDGDDLLNGGIGDDRIGGENGHDKIYGDKDNDVLSGGKANDTIYGGDGNDLLVGESGDDWMAGGQGTDQLYGDIGADTLYGQQGDDFLYGGDADDLLYGGEDNDRIYGEDGHDTIYGATGNDVVHGGDGNDTLYGDEDNDVLVGASGDDILWGGSGDDRLYGEAGVDWLKGYNGLDLCDGGAGGDTCVEQLPGETAIARRWYEYESAAPGTLGNPIWGLKLGERHAWQYFEKGVIYYSEVTGAHAIHGNLTDIGTFLGAFAAAGFESGLGLPTEDKVDLPDGTSYQSFQKGGIVANASGIQVLTAASVQQQVPVLSGQVALQTTVGEVEVVVIGSGSPTIVEALPAPVPTPGTVLLDVSSAPSVVVVDGWTRAYGETIDAEEYFGATAAAIVSVFVGNPGPLVAYSEEHIKQQLYTISRNMTTEVTLKFLEDVMHSEVPLPLNGYEFRFNILTEKREVKLFAGTPMETTLFSYNVHTPYIEWRPIGA